MQKGQSSSQMDHFLQGCKKNRLKITPQRTAIFKVLAESKMHPSADMVFRTLLTFRDKGMLDLIESRSGVRRFDANVIPHHHIHCVRCGTVFDLTDKSLDSLPVPSQVVQNYQFISKRVVFNVICKECQKNHP